MKRNISLNYCNYLPEYDIHWIDYSGVIGLDEGLLRIKNLEKYIKANQKANMPLKVIMDGRKYLKVSPETHDELAKISRKVFGKFEIILAVLDATHAIVLSDKEAWFKTEAKALEWLKEK